MSDDPVVVKRIAAALAEGQLMIPTYCAVCVKKFVLVEARGFTNGADILADSLASYGWGYRPAYIAKLHMAVIYPVCPDCVEQERDRRSEAEE